MRALLQRVNHAAVTVDDAVIGRCDGGLLVYVGVMGLQGSGLESVVTCCER